MCIIHFGDKAAFLTLRIHGRVEPDSQSYWDANWLYCTAEASAGAFHEIVAWQLRNEDLARFLHSIETLGGGAREAVLDTGDGWLDVRLVRDDQGRSEARCQLVENPVGGSALEFRVHLEQRDLAVLIGQLHHVLERFPIIGCPLDPPNLDSSSERGTNPKG